MILNKLNILKILDQMKKSLNEKDYSTVESYHQVLTEFVKDNTLWHDPVIAVDDRSHFYQIYRQAQEALILKLVDELDNKTKVFKDVAISMKEFRKKRNHV